MACSVKWVLFVVQQIAWVRKLADTPHLLCMQYTASYGSTWRQFDGSNNVV